MIFQHWKYWKAICLKMNKFYLKNRVYIQLFVTLISIFIFYNIVTSSADSIESSDNNSPISETNVEIISVNIPQGSAAAEISSILDATGVITSKLAFELYLRNENLTDKTELTRNSLDAHQALMGVNMENKIKFKEVALYLEKKINSSGSS